MSYLIVENSGAPFSAKYDGKRYDFNTGEQVPVTVEAAQHIFAFGLANKDEMFARHGWMQRSTERDQAMNRLGQFKFISGEMQVVAETPQLEVEEQTTEHLEPEDAVTEQGSAPLPGVEGEGKVSDGTGKELDMPVFTTMKPKSKSMLDQLTG